MQSSTRKALSGVIRNASAIAIQSWRNLIVEVGVMPFTIWKLHENKYVSISRYT